MIVTDNSLTVGAGQIDKKPAHPFMTYRGRFAPSPTGPLHFGSLVAAVGSYLQARHAGGEWLVRIEDLDPPRSVPGSADLILHTLEALGFTWHGPVLYQSTRTEAYQQALQQLIDQGLSYPCSCTRSELQALVHDHISDQDELRYPGLCRNGSLRAQGPHAWRFRVPIPAVHFTDGLHGEHHTDLSSIGDFVIKRRDGWFAYQLAVVVDDAAQGITEVVRGADLLFNSPRQIALQRALGYPTPGYLHLPLATDALGQKLGKATAAPPLDTKQAAPTLCKALHFLGQSPPAELRHATVDSVWQWAIVHWNSTAVRTQAQ
jgi:glutamyl-Q tRNA(Asp) synthetase